MTQPTSIGGANAAGQITTNYSGSRQEWEDMVARDLIRRWKTGAGGLPGYGDASIGQPSQADFGNPDAPLSYQTQQYFVNYVKKFGANDPWIVENFGTPPTSQVTYQDDPNSPRSLQDANNKFSAEENAKDRALNLQLDANQTARTAMQIASNERIASMQESGATARTQMQIDASWREAQLDAATRRYIAEGDWGVQKWVTTENNTAAMERLQAQLQFDRESLAQQAVAEGNRHHEQMIGLALEVAKYDAELAASPRNWVAYAAWLQSRNIVVDGMSLAMAAQEVPENSIDPETVQQATGNGVSALQSDTQLQQASGASGGSTSSQDAFGANTTEIASGQAGATSAAQQATTTPTLNPHQPTPSAQDLSNVTDYAAFARQLLGMSPNPATDAQYSQESLQNVQNGLNTANRKISGFGAWTGPTQNSLGVTVPELSGKDVNYKQFSNLLPTEQQMKVGSVESVRGSSGVTDWVAEMERSRPKGGGTEQLAWG